jgi:hypothetical protein
MIKTKTLLLGGAAVSLALATIAAPGLPARAQEAADVAACAEFEGEALAACLEAEAAPEAAEDIQPEPPPEATTDEPDLPEDTGAEAVQDEPEAVEEAEDAPEVDADAASV